VQSVLLPTTREVQISQQQQQQPQGKVQQAATCTGLQAHVFMQAGSDLAAAKA
jgi:hypothetical protein